MFFDLEGRIHNVNDAFQRMSGYAREHFTDGGVRWEEVTSPEYMPATRRAVEQLRTVSQRTPYEKQYIRPDGTRWWGLFAGKRLSENECVKFGLDLTESKQAQVTNEQLRRANVDLDNFIYTASHDLKAPISNIESLLQPLRYQLPPEVRQGYDVELVLTPLPRAASH